MRALTLASQDVQSLVGRVAVLLSERGVEAYLVGGYVRDLLSGRDTHDVDMALASADPIAIGRAVADALDGAFYVLDDERRFGRVLAPGEDGSTVTFDFTPLHGTLKEDLAHRDFTINAMALPMTSVPDPEHIIDPWGGRRDLDAGLLRVLGENAFRDDPARLLRTVRLTGELDLRIEEETAKFAISHAHELARVSPDRVQDEFCRILALEHSHDALREADRLHLLREILPELDESRGVEQPKEHYWDVFNHLLETVGVFERVINGHERTGDTALALLPWRSEIDDYFTTEVTAGHTRATLTKLACLLHDIAKPRTKTTEPSGRTRFLGHPEQGAEMAQEIMGRLRFPRKDVSFVSIAVSQHLRPTQLSHELEPPTRRALYRYRRDAADVAVATLYLSMADYLAARGPLLGMDEWRPRAAHYERVLVGVCETPEQDETQRPLVDGHILMEGLGLSPGPLVGRLRDAVQEAIAVGEVANVEEALEFALQLLRADDSEQEKRRGE